MRATTRQIGKLNKRSFIKGCFGALLALAVPTVLAKPKYKAKDVKVFFDDVEIKPIPEEAMVTVSYTRSTILCNAYGEPLFQSDFTCQETWEKARLDAIRGIKYEH